MQASGLLTPRPSRVPSGSGARTPTAAGPSSNPADSADLWEDILRSADRAKTHAHKNIVLLAERHRGRTHLLDKLAGKRRQRPEGASALAIGYQVLESEDRDEGKLFPRGLQLTYRRCAARVRVLSAIIAPDLAQAC